MSNQTSELRAILHRAEQLACIAYDWELGRNGKVEIDGKWTSCCDLRHEFRLAKETLARPTAEPVDVQADESAKELAEAQKYNDTDKPLSEVVAAISDAVLLVMPDAESCSGGTIIERVETAVKCATDLQAKLEAAHKQNCALIDALRPFMKDGEIGSALLEGECLK